MENIKNEKEINTMEENNVNTVIGEKEDNTMNETETKLTVLESPALKITLALISALGTLGGGIISYRAKKLQSADYQYRCDTLVRAIEAGADSDAMYRLFRDRSLIEKIFGDRKRK